MTDEQNNGGAAPDLPTADPSEVAEAVKTAIAEQAEPPTLELEPCPCGEKPTGLYIEMPERGKYGRASGQCCAEWSIEFRNGYEADPEKTLAKAAKAWNDTPRAAA
jgi:hypothetical protein